MLSPHLAKINFKTRNRNLNWELLKPTKGDAEKGVLHWSRGIKKALKDAGEGVRREL